ncbi:hypothetical protein O181_059847 [Austropuccinia psidii MF-1]|uniref:Reverse transcriptase Ty1/copia-type domain-containing protein n=1 Tax=Austropuccinia psidii MF-1 TaxID=1389203 RepID=A0A9Q3EHH1_9BASI|nr:hypothetical protein [Austropuccinia psidii MF-1]
MDAISQKMNEALKMKWDEAICGLVGIFITPSGNGYEFHQKELISKLTTLKPGKVTAKAPLQNGCDLKSNKSNEMDKEYLRHIGMLLYIAQGSRPDICYSVSYLACFSMGTDESHWQALEHLIAYLRGMIEDKIIISEKEGDPDFNCFVDANWGGEGNRSAQGFIIMHGGNPIAWKSKPQTTAKAEYIALSFAAKECLWLSNLFSNFLHNNTPFLLSDNRAAIGIATECVSRKQTQHLIRELNIINEYLVQKKINLKWISTKDQLANIFTKGIGPIAMKPFTKYLARIQQNVVLEGSVVNILRYNLKNEYAYRKSNLISNICKLARI